MKSPNPPPPVSTPLVYNSQAIVKALIKGPL